VVVGEYRLVVFGNGHGVGADSVWFSMGAYDRNSCSPSVHFSRRWNIKWRVGWSNAM